MANDAWHLMLETVRHARRHHVGKVYRHYRNKKKWLVSDIAITEDSHEVLIVFHRKDQPGLRYVRPLREWDAILPGGKQRYSLVGTAFDSDNDPAESLPEAA